YETLGLPAPAFCHAKLVRDAAGRRLAKRTGGLSIRDLRARGLTPAAVLTESLESLTPHPRPEAR
ncbi:MAG: hypothetical protein ACKOTB_14030, partial [Planctomycetia bacterium]